MAKDLLLQLVELYIQNDKTPDGIEAVFIDDNKKAIRLFWLNSEKEKDFGYSPERYLQVDKILKDYWKTKTI